VGCYVNLKVCSKEDWLFTHGVSTGCPASFDATPQDMLLMCLVNNGPFTAVGVIFDAREFSCFTDSADTRQKSWYWVKIEDLFGVSPLERYLERR